MQIPEEKKAFLSQTLLSAGEKMEFMLFKIQKTLK